MNALFVSDIIIFNIDNIINIIRATTAKITLNVILILYQVKFSINVLAA